MYLQTFLRDRAFEIRTDVLSRRQLGAKRRLRYERQKGRRLMTTMASGFVVCVTQYPVGTSCQCPTRSKVQQPCTVRYKATKEVEKGDD